MKVQSANRKKRNILIGFALITAIFLTGFVGFLFTRRNQNNKNKNSREAYIETKYEAVDKLNFKLSHTTVYTQNSDENTLSTIRFTIGVKDSDIEKEGQEKPYKVNFNVSYEIVGEVGQYLQLGDLTMSAVEEGENQKYDDLSSGRDITSASFIKSTDEGYLVSTYAATDIVRAYYIPVEFKTDTIKETLFNDESTYSAFKESIKSSYINLKLA